MLWLINVLLVNFQFSVKFIGLNNLEFRIYNLFTINIFNIYEMKNDKSLNLFKFELTYV